MPTKNYKPEQIVTILRQIEVVMANLGSIHRKLERLCLSRYTRRWSQPWNCCHGPGVQRWTALIILEWEEQAFRAERH